MVLTESLAINLPSCLGMKTCRPIETETKQQSPERHEKMSVERNCSVR